MVLAQDPYASNGGRWTVDYDLLFEFEIIRTGDYEKPIIKFTSSNKN
jgi:hypothetical protein